MDATTFKDADGREWKLVPVEATQAMLDAAEKIDWSGEDVLGNCCNQWYAMLAAAPQHPAVEVEVTDEMAESAMSQTLREVAAKLADDYLSLNSAYVALAAEKAEREALLDGVVKELREVCGQMPDSWIQFDVGYLRDLAKRLEHLTGGEVQKSTNTAPGRGCRCNSDLRPHYVATIAAGLASHPSY
jgi:hypothetical protein